ncbi:MAG TPA: methyltransferase domain-containing protein [Kofleriaceae bacterium]|nr:methyltransferase domain-containing protein [Kofleriaceae bacterium]
MTDAFHAFEHAGWQRAASAYPDTFGQVTLQAVEPLLDAVGAGPGVRLLDIATGPGYVAAAATRRGANATGIDFAPAMVEHARQLHPGLDIREGDALNLPFDAATFDAAVAGFVLLHVDEPERALAEMRRVLRPGGRGAFTVWMAPEHTAGFRITLDAIAKHGDTESPAPPGPPFFRFSDPRECERALLAAGFTSPKVIEVPMTWRLPSGDALFEAMAEGGVRTSALLNAQSPKARAAIRSTMITEVASFIRDAEVVLPMPCVLASAVAR